MTAERQVDEDAVRRICSLYDIGGQVLSTAPAGGTAGANVRLRTAAGWFFLRSRSAEHAHLDQILYDHELLGALARQGFCVSAPLANRQGRSFSELDGRIFELSRWVEGRQFEQASAAQIADLGGRLAELHAITARMRQRKDKPWEQDPRYLLSELGSLTQGADVGHKAPMLDRITAELGRLAESLGPGVRRRLPQAIVHGDLHPANALFDGRRLVGLFDWDWANRQMRITDICDAIFFFARRAPNPFSGDDIRLLTCGLRLDEAMVEAFLGAYEAASAVTRAERELLNDFLAARWLQERIRGMRKVSVPERLDFLDRGDLLEVLEHLKSFTVGGG